MRYGLVALLLWLLPSAASAQALVVAGDSIAAGAFMTNTRRHFTALFPRFSRGRVLVLNVSRGGATIAPGGPWPAFSPNMLSFASGVQGHEVLVMLGVNDYLSARPLAAVESSYRTLLSVPAGLGEAITCVTPLWLTGEDTATNALGRALEEYRGVIRSVCAEFGGRVIEGRTLVPESAAYFLGGALHPNDMGPRALAKNLWAAMEAEQ